MASKGGKARASKLSKERRSSIASNAAKSRWLLRRETIMQIYRCVYCKNMGTIMVTLFGENRWVCEEHKPGFKT